MLKHTLFFIGRWATNILLACLAIASSVRPEDAMSNISGWASKFNLPDPVWLQSHTADSVVFWGALTGVFVMLVAPKIWNKFKRKSATTDTIAAAKRDVALSDALWRAFEGDWEKRSHVDPLSSGKSSSPQTVRFYRTASEIRQKAFDGILPIWAKRPRSSLYEPVPRGFWTNHDLQAGYSLHPYTKDTFVYVTHPLIVGEVPHARTMVWEDFMTSKEVVDRLWPKGGSERAYISLADAARIAYEKTRGGTVAAHAEHFGETPNGILTWYAYRIMRFVPIYGKRLPSSISELVPECDFVFLA